MAGHARLSADHCASKLLNCVRPRITSIWSPRRTGVPFASAVAATDTSMQRYRAPAPTDSCR